MPAEVGKVLQRRRGRNAGASRDSHKSSGQVARIEAYLQRISSVPGKREIEWSGASYGVADPHRQRRIFIGVPERPAVARYKIDGGNDRRLCINSERTDATSIVVENERETVRDGTGKDGNGRSHRKITV